MGYAYLIMKILELAVVLAGLYVLGQCWHCAVDEQTSGNSIQYDIDTKPSRRYWLSNMQFFVFGQIEDPSNARITAGFYDKDDHNKLVYGATVDCSAGTWQTSYMDAATGVLSIWKTGYLNKTCEKNEHFDITYELQQRYRGKFMFNGEPLEHTLMLKGTTGKYRIQKLPIDLINGTHFKAEIGLIQGGGNFDRYAYGKCVAYPDHLKTNCTEVQIWGMRRSKGTGEVTVTVDDVKYSTGYWHIGQFGAWTVGNDVNCWSKAPQFFSVVQSVHSDENSQEMPYCCCSYMNGTLDEASCASWAVLGGACTYTCSKYVDEVIYDTVMAQEENSVANSAGANDTFSNIIG